MIAQVLADRSANKSRAAARLGISRTQLYVRLRRYRLSWLPGAFQGVPRVRPSAHERS